MRYRPGLIPFALGAVLLAGTPLGARVGVHLGSAPAQAQQPAQAPARNLAREEANRRLVVDFYERFFNRHDLSAASVLAENYIQHNPLVPDGRQAVVEYFTGFFRDNPKARARIVRSAADGDLVWLHVQSRDDDDDRGTAVVDIFRVANGRIVEHWDVVQPVPDASANDNGVF
jgi:predicted SnoaL-like aldol condensation-catalyzing enzyme